MYHMHLFPKYKPSKIGHFLHQNKSIKMLCCKMATGLFLSNQEGGVESIVDPFRAVLSLLPEREGGNHFTIQSFHEKASSRP